jgi:hypothetical protein
MSQRKWIFMELQITDYLCSLCFLWSILLNSGLVGLICECVELTLHTRRMSRINSDPSTRNQMVGVDRRAVRLSRRLAQPESRSA